MMMSRKHADSFQLKQIPFGEIRSLFCCFFFYFVFFVCVFLHLAVFFSFHCINPLMQILLKIVLKKVFLLSS